MLNCTYLPHAATRQARLSLRHDGLDFCSPYQPHCLSEPCSLRVPFSVFRTFHLKNTVTLLNNLVDPGDHISVQGLFDSPPSQHSLYGLSLILPLSIPRSFIQSMTPLSLQDQQTSFFGELQKYIKNDQTCGDKRCLCIALVLEAYGCWWE